MAMRDPYDVTTTTPDKAEFLQDPYADPFEEQSSDMGGFDLDAASAAASPQRREAINPDSLFGVNPSIARAISSQKQQKDNRFLRFERRSVYERSMHNTGIAYLSGLGIGGMVGFFDGLRNVKGTRFRIRVNSILNGCGRRGARTANALGVLAMMFSFAEGGLEYVEADKYFAQLPMQNTDMLMPIAAAGIAGMVYRLPAASGPLGIPIVLASGLFGMGAVTALGMVGPSIFGDKAPISFS